MRRSRWRAGDRLGTGGIQAAEQAQHAETGAEALFGVRPAGQHGDDQALGVRSDAARLTLQALRRPFAISPVCARHMVGLGAMPRSAITPGMGGDAFAAVEYLDRSRGGAGVDLFADQGMRNGIEEALDFDVIVDADPREAPFGKLEVVLRKRLHGRPLDRLEQLPAAHAKPTNRAPVHPLQDGGDRRVALGQ